MIMTPRVRATSKSCYGNDNSALIRKMWGGNGT